VGSAEAPYAWRGTVPPLFSRDEKRLLGGLAIVTACSWWRYLATGSLKVDENYPARLTGYAMLVVLVAGWALAVLGWRGLLAEPPARPRRTAFAALGIAAWMLPMLSNDLFSVMSYGSLAASGHDVYGSAAALPQSRFYRFVGEHWNDTACMYGPTTLIAALPAGLAGQSPWAGLAILRVAWFLPVALAMELSLRHLRDAPFFHAMVWLNPLWIIEGPGQLHADLLGLVALVAGIVLVRTGRPRTSFAFYAAAVLSKYSFAPAGLWFWLSGEGDDRRRQGRLARLAAMGVAFGAVAVALYAPFWVGPVTVLGPLRGLASMNPGGSITEVLGIVVQFLRHGGVTPPAMDVQEALALDRASKEQTWRIIEWVVRLVFLGIVARVLPAVLRKGADPKAVALGTGAVTVALLTIAGHRFQCWYLPAALPFFGLACTEAWRRWWIAVVAVAVPVEFACVLERSSAVYPAWGAATTGLQVIVFILWFWARYLRSGGDAAPRAAIAPAEP
jgi:hypothetical protein